MCKNNELILRKKPETKLSEQINLKEMIKAVDCGLLERHSFDGRQCTHVGILIYS